MLDFEEELKKFKPSLEVEEIEEAVYEVIVADLHDFVNALCFSGIF